MLVTAPSNGGTAGIYTTDKLGEGNIEGGMCTRSFGGTSSACPLGAGVVALMLEANPALSWRDVQSILARTARLIDEDDPDWTTNAAGYHINHKYGFGLLDAAAAVDLAAQWNTTTGEWRTLNSFQSVEQPIPDLNQPQGAYGVNATISIGQDVQLRSVQVRLNASHTTGTDLEVVLLLLLE